MSYLFWLKDAQMMQLQPFFPKNHRKLPVDDRCVLRGTIFSNRDGLRWCDAPKEDGRNPSSLRVLYDRSY